MYTNSTIKIFRHLHIHIYRNIADAYLKQMNTLIYKTKSLDILCSSNANLFHIGATSKILQKLLLDMYGIYFWGKNNHAFWKSGN